LLLQECDSQQATAEIKTLKRAKELGYGVENRTAKSASY
jgi:hypothetical protein